MDEFKQETEQRGTPPLRGLYSKVNISVRTLNIIIVVLVILLIGCMAFGIKKGGFRVTFDTQGGTPVEMQSGIMHGELIDVPEEPTREGFEFDGWYLDSAGTMPWDPEEDKFQLTAEFDEPEEGGARSNLYLDPYGETIWLEIAEPNGDFRLFQMEDQDAGFKGVWSFVMELDDWGGPEYLVNGQAEDKDEWDQDMEEALRMRGDAVLTGYLPATEENIQSQVDRVLTEDELEKWS